MSFRASLSKAGRVETRSEAQNPEGKSARAASKVDFSTTSVPSEAGPDFGRNDEKIPSVSRVTRVRVGTDIMIQVQESGMHSK